MKKGGKKIPVKVPSKFDNVTSQNYSFKKHRAQIKSKMGDVTALAVDAGGIENCMRMNELEVRQERFKDSENLRSH